MLKEKKLGKGGQFTIPVHIRRELGITQGEKIAIEANDNGDLVFKRLTGSCILCGSRENVVKTHGKYLCRKCISEAQALLTDGAAE